MLRLKKKFMHWFVTTLDQKLNKPAAKASAQSERAPQDRASKTAELSIEERTVISDIDAADAMVDNP